MNNEPPKVSIDTHLNTMTDATKEIDIVIDELQGVLSAIKNLVQAFNNPTKHTKKALVDMFIQLDIDYINDAPSCEQLLINAQKYNDELAAGTVAVWDHITDLDSQIEDMEEEQESVNDLEDTLLDFIERPDEISAQALRDYVPIPYEDLFNPTTLVTRSV